MPRVSIAYADSERLREIRARAEQVAAEVAGPKAAQVDEQALWPEHTMRALAQAGLLGLHVPTRLGGLGQGLTGLLLTTEALAAGCSSSGLCFGMHSVGSAVLAARATPEQEERFLRPIAEGRHISSLALSEAGTGSHLYLTETRLERDGDEFIVNGRKEFITNGSRADSYVATSMSTTGEAAPGEFNMLVIEKGTPGMNWTGEWTGLGMRGNSARSLQLDGARVPTSHLLGAEGDQVWYMFEIVVPYFIMAMAGVYLGIAQSALDHAISHARTRRFSPAGDLLASSSLVQYRIAEMWAQVEKGRRLVYHAAQLGDQGDVGALPAILSAKAEMDEIVVSVTNEAMTLGGGSAYRENSTLARLMRDARASKVMSPTTDLLRLWTGRVLLDEPVL